MTTTPQSELVKITNLLKSDKIDEAILNLNSLKNKTDSSEGGLAADDVIINPQAQQKVIPLIENVIQVLEKLVEYITKRRTHSYRL